MFCYEEITSECNIGNDFIDMDNAKMLAGQWSQIFYIYGSIFLTGIAHLEDWLRCL